MKKQKLIPFSEANPILLVDSHHGIYIPQIFAEGYSCRLTKPLTEEQVNDLKLPENEFYWETWDDVLNMTIKDDNGIEHSIIQNDGDVWAIPCDMMDKIAWDEM